MPPAAANSVLRERWLIAAERDVLCLQAFTEPLADLDVMRQLAEVGSGHPDSGILKSARKKRPIQRLHLGVCLSSPGPSGPTTVLAVLDTSPRVMSSIGWLLVQPRSLSNRTREPSVRTTYR